MTNPDRQGNVEDSEGGASPSLRSLQSGFGVEESPGHCANVIEELQGGCCLIAMRGVRNAENPEVNVNFHRGSICNPVVLKPVPSEAPCPQAVQARCSLRVNRTGGRAMFTFVRRLERRPIVGANVQRGNRRARATNIGVAEWREAP